VQQAERRNANGRAAVVAAVIAIVACTLLAGTHSRGAAPTALTGWLATGRAGEPKFFEPPSEAAAQGGVSGANASPFHSDGANYGIGSAAGPLDGKNFSPDTPKSLMRPKWAAREGREAAAHSLAQPFLVPLEANGLPVAGAEVTPFGEYSPVTPHYTNPLAQFIPNVTYVEDGNDVVGFEGPADAAEEVAAEEAEEGEEKIGEEPVTSEEKELDIMKSALRQVAAKRGNVKDLVARLESSEAREEAVAGAWQRKPQALAKLQNDLVQEDALMKEHTSAAQRIRNSIAQLRGVAPARSYAANSLISNLISPVYSAPPSVTAGAVQAMQQADIIHQINMGMPQQAQVQVTTTYK